MSLKPDRGWQAEGLELATVAAQYGAGTAAYTARKQSSAGQIPGRSQAQDSGHRLFARLLSDTSAAPSSTQAKMRPAYPDGLRAILLDTNQQGGSSPDEPS